MDSGLRTNLSSSLLVFTRFVNQLCAEGFTYSVLVRFQPHLPFNSPAKFFDLYPQSEIELPGDQEPPKDMPPIAWSNWGELQAYVDIHALNNSGQPGELLPPTVVKDLRRAYYASVSYSTAPRSPPPITPVAYNLYSFVL